mmetsp:Transcript_16582/g.38913  ORF Transcript_16582/g.38913 Transcript_16582/m.38913 type:complete len:216 (-) Transcript_16582:1068-1715(-)
MTPLRPPTSTRSPTFRGEAFVAGERSAKVGGGCNAAWLLNEGLPHARPAAGVLLYKRSVCPGTVDPTISACSPERWTSTLEVRSEKVPVKEGLSSSSEAGDSPMTVSFGLSAPVVGEPPIAPASRELAALIVRGLESASPEEAFGAKVEASDGEASPPTAGMPGFKVARTGPGGALRGAAGQGLRSASTERVRAAAVGAAMPPANRFGNKQAAGP